MELSINIEIRKTIYFHLLEKLKIAFIKKPLIKGYINGKKSFSLCLADIMTEK